MDKKNNEPVEPVEPIADAINTLKGLEEASHLSAFMILGAGFVFEGGYNRSAHLAVYQGMMNDFDMMGEGKDPLDPANQVTPETPETPEDEQE